MKLSKKDRSSPNQPAAAPIKVVSPPLLDGGVPTVLLSTLLLGVPFLTATIVFELLQSSRLFVPTATLSTLIIQGLVLCFYWRRIPPSKIKTFLSKLYVGNLWVYMTLIVLISLMPLFAPLASMQLDIPIIATGFVLGVGAGISLLFVALWIKQSLKTKSDVPVISLQSATALLLVAFLVASGVMNRSADSEAFEEITLSAKSLESHQPRLQEPVMQDWSSTGMPPWVLPAGSISPMPPIFEETDLILQHDFNKHIAAGVPTQSGEQTSSVPPDHPEELPTTTKSTQPGH